MIDETEFVKITANHQEFARKLRQLGISDDEILKQAALIASRWFRLSSKHLTEAARALRTKSTRAA